MYAAYLLSALVPLTLHSQNNEDKIKELEDKYFLIKNSTKKSRFIKSPFKKSEVDSYKNGLKAFANSLNLKIEVIEIREYTYLWFFKYKTINIIVEGN